MNEIDQSSFDFCIFKSWSPNVTYHHLACTAVPTLLWQVDGERNGRLTAVSNGGVSHHRVQRAVLMRQQNYCSQRPNVQLETHRPFMTFPFARLQTNGMEPAITGSVRGYAEPLRLPAANGLVPSG